MNRLIKTLLIVLIAHTTALAQHDHGMAMTRIHAAKMVYISDRLRLSEHQYSSFVPIYTEYEKEVKSTRHSFMDKYKGAHPDDIDDASTRRYIDDNLDYQQAVIDIKRKYNDRFLAILSPHQLADLYIAEHEFKQILLKRLNNERGGRYR